MDTDTEKQILAELRKQTRWNVNFLIALPILLVLFMASLVFKDRIVACLKPIIQSAEPLSADSWDKAAKLMDDGDPSKGEAMMRRLVTKHPDYYYNYKYMGFKEQKLGRFKEAEVNFRKAYELFPTDENEKNLAAIRKAIEWKSKPANQVAEETARKLVEPQH